MAHTDHARPSRKWGSVWHQGKSYTAITNRAYKSRRENLDMREQLSDLGSERDWYRLHTVGVHLPNPNFVRYAEWECELLGVPYPHPHDRVWVHEIVHSTRSQGYDVGFDVYFLEHARTRTKVEAMIEAERPMTAWERERQREAERKAAAKARKRAEMLAARQRTLTDEQRREILRRESVGMRGYSRV